MNLFTNLFTLVLLLLISLNSWADDLRPASLNVVAQDATTLDLTWKMPIRNGQRQSLEVVLDAQAREHRPRRSQSTNYAYIQQWSVEREQGIRGLEITIEGLKGETGDVLLRLVDENQQTITAVLNTEKITYKVPESLELSWIDTVVTYVVLGIEHILIGLDHLFFVACLVYISGTLRKLFWTITGFTIAHSVTLIIAALDLVTIPIPPVEAVIALSIVFLAWEIARNNKDSISLKYPVLVSSSFGLLHGFGFASVLSEIGLPVNEKVTALLSFNIGVELGQMLFVASLFVFYWPLSRVFKSITLESLRYPISYVSGLVATVWMMQRLAGF